MIRAFAAGVAAFILLAPAASASGPTIPEMAGQLVLARMSGSAPSSEFLRRVERGQVGAVILFPDNFPRGNPAPLVATLQAAAAKGHQPKLLISIDRKAAW